jgi:hypothetical protein
MWSSDVIGVLLPPMHAAIPSTWKLNKNQQQDTQVWVKVYSAKYNKNQKFYKNDKN